MPVFPSRDDLTKTETADQPNEEDDGSQKSDDEVGIYPRERPPGYPIEKWESSLKEFLDLLPAVDDPYPYRSRSTSPPRNRKQNMDHINNDPDNFLSNQKGRLRRCVSESEVYSITSDRPGRTRVMSACSAAVVLMNKEFIVLKVEEELAEPLEDLTFSSESVLNEEDTQSERMRKAQVISQHLLPVGPPFRIDGALHSPCHYLSVNQNLLRLAIVEVTCRIIQELKLRQDKIKLLTSFIKFLQEEPNAMYVWSQHSAVIIDYQINHARTDFEIEQLLNHAIPRHAELIARKSIDEEESSESQ
ncbi:unnamed protein product [Caenorhabditis auriculariae]|uniref:Uncharacterized protein n=1 Tax=Caenorhabditis auriculariae TaxID=2777116 RepID=A0A8S1H338_9PELO|nr:unnamed protein product [Caenorhabditis auriculariae]